MLPELERFFEQAKDIPGFESFDSSNINATTDEGENALHLAIDQENSEIAKLLIKGGININQPGENAYTPLHEACMIGNREIVRALVEAGADLFALTEGDSPFTVARLSGNDDICDYLSDEMKKRQDRDPKMWVRARINQLQSEINRLERRLG